MIEKMSGTPKSKVEFLKEKALNFKTWLSAYSPDTEAQAWMSSFNENMLLPTVLGILCPIAAAGKLDETADQALTHFKIPEAERPEVKAKLVRYFQMFVEVAQR